MGYDDMGIESGGGKFLKVEAGKSVDIHILTKSDDMVIQKVYWDGEKYAPYKEYAGIKEKPTNRYTINVLDRADNQVKIYQFGTNVAIGLQEIARVLKDDGETVHDVDIRISRVSEKPVRYSVVQKKMAGPIPSDLELHDLKKAAKVDDDETVPF